MLQDLLKDLDMETQDFRPSVVFINGEYWGIQNLRERINKYYIEQHYNVDKDNIDLVELYGIVLEGDDTAYTSLMNFFSLFSKPSSTS